MQTFHWFAMQIEISGLKELIWYHILIEKKSSNKALQKCNMVEILIHCKQEKVVFNLCVCAVCVCACLLNFHRFLRIPSDFLLSSFCN